MSVKNIVAVYDNLSKLDLRILRIIEVAHRKYEYVPMDLIVKWSNKSWEIVSKSLKKLNSYGLVIRWKGSYTGYRLTYAGYDILALHTLAKRGIIEKISPTPLGVGKESDVYTGEEPNGEKIVIKFHRLGRTSFRQTKKFRIWIGERRHVTWLYESRLSAHMEFKALVMAYEAKVNVPKPITVNRHAVVTKFVDAYQLSEVWRSIENPDKVLENIIEDVRKLYCNASIVHGDLSEFNVLVNPNDESYYIIDWPQWVPRMYKNAEDLLRRDLENIITFFQKKFDIEVNFDEVMKYVTEGVEKGELELEEAFTEFIGEKELKSYLIDEELEKEIDKIEKEFEE